MANIIKPKRSNTAAKVPTTTELISGELGVNMADRKVYINNGTAVVQVGAGNLSGLGDVAIATPANGQALTYNSTTSKWENTTSAGSGTVTSVGITPGTGVTVSNSPITTSGNIAVGLSTKLTAIENLSGAGFITQNGSGAIAGRTLQAGTGISIQHGNGSSQDPVITNSAPDQTVALTGAGATTISGTYPNFTITSVNTTYGAATSTVPGLIELASDTAQTVAANAITTTASRTYGLQLNSAGQGVVNVPWTDTVYSLPAATSTVRGGIELGSNTAQTVASNAVTATASRSYALQVNADGQGVVNVPWTDTVYSLPAATSTIRGGIELGSDTAQTVAANAVTATASRSYALQVNADGQGVVNVPWTDTNSGGTVTSVGGTGTVSGLSLSGTVTTSGNLTLGGTLAVTPSNFASQTAKTFLAAPNAAAGVPTFRTIVASDIPTLNQNTTGSAATLTTGRTIAMTGDVTYTSGSFNGSANVTGTSTLANSGVTAGTYTKVTVNAKGLTTSGTTLAASDIPELTMAKLPGAAYKQSVRCATTANLTATATTTTLTNSSTLAALVLDGITVATNDRVLVKNQTTAAQNGIYTVTNVGSASVAWVLTRTADADNSSEIGAAIVNVDSGTANGGELWTTTFKITDTLGTTAMNWYEVLYNTGSWGISITGSSASTTGNAATATTLQTARTINGTSFNGSSNITVTANTTSTLTRGTYLTGNNFNGSAATTWAVDATTTNTASKVVARDSSGNFAAGTITAALSGNATTATTLQTARTIGGVSFNGSANINLPGVNTAGNQNTSGNAATASNASLLNSISAVNLYNNMGDVHSARTSFDASTPSYGFGYRFVQGNANGPATGATQYYSWYIGLGSEYPATGAGSYGAMFAVDRNSTTPYLSVRYNEGNSFSAWRKIHAGYADSAGSTTGNAATATALQTARTIGGVSFNGTANINLPGVNTAGNQNTSGTAAVATAATVTTSATASAFKVPFVNTTASTTGNYGLLQDSTATFTYNPSTNTLAVGTVSGALSGNASTATTLQTSRTIQTNLASTSSASFNGSANITPGVTGTLPIANGGTGATTAAAARTALGAGTVTSVGGTGTISGLTLTGTVTSSGSLTLGGNLTIAADMIYNSFTATAAQTTFTTTNTYTSGKIEVFVNGVKMVNGSDVTVTSGTSVVMASGLPVGTRVDLVYPI